MSLIDLGAARSQHQLSCLWERIDWERSDERIWRAGAWKLGDKPVSHTRQRLKMNRM